MVGRAGFEPATNWLKANCSTTELTTRQGWQIIRNSPLISSKIRQNYSRQLDRLLHALQLPTRQAGSGTVRKLLNHLAKHGRGALVAPKALFDGSQLVS